MTQRSVAVGIDTGGTFTDLAAIDGRTGRLAVTKVPSCPSDPASAPIAALEHLFRQEAAEAADICHIVHGTTIATNAILESSYPPVGMITTEGFRDVLEIARQARTGTGDDMMSCLYDMNYRKPAPIVPRRLRLEVPERVGPSGEVVIPLDVNAITEAALELAQRGARSFAICFLNSYANAAHEETARAAVAAALPGVHISTSARVLREYREYERFSTTALNAAATPILQAYLEALEQRLETAGVRGPLYVMQSVGGVLKASSIMDRGAYTVYSGLMGGVLGASQIARMSGYSSVVGMDMGGTSTDISLLEKGLPQITTDGMVGPHAIRFPMLDVIAIGAGGGSIGWIDSGGLLRVGPRSAGASPGPVCYGHGGTEPTVTDAHIVLGRLNPRHILGGAIQVNRGAALEAIENRLARTLGMGVSETAAGILRVVNATMLRGLRLMSVQRGKDPRDFALVAFGGAGPLHGSDLARELGTRTVVVPPHPGVLSAMGALFADVLWDSVETCMGPLDATILPRLTEVVDRLVKEGYPALTRQGVAPGEGRVNVSLDLRYMGQGYEVTVPVNGGALDEAALNEAKVLFHRRHQERYSHSSVDEPVELVNVRIAAVGTVPEKVRDPGSMARPEDPSARAVPVTEREAYFLPVGRALRCPVYQRDHLVPGITIKGPAIVEQLDSTAVINPGDTARADKWGNLVVSVGGSDSNA